MYCVKSVTKIEETIKKSRFIGLIYPCQSEHEAVTILNYLKIKHASANHIAYAYRIKTEKGIICRFHDAGEPSGTAGKPILKYIEGYDLVNVLGVVVRYFGGVKLGAGGLTRAYGQAAKKAIQESEVIELIEFSTLRYVLNYSQLQLFEYTLNKFSGRILNQDFAVQVTLLIELPERGESQFLQIFPSQPPPI